MLIEKKLLRLKKIISKMESVLVAFSGGLDSSFLLKVATLVLPKKKILAVTADSSTYPHEELSFSKKFASQLDVRHKIIRTGELKDRSFIANPINRCYFCKSELFSKLRAESKKLKLNFVLDATNASDKNDFRPGKEARRQFKIRSPLEEAGITKKDIRILSKKLNLNTWNKPSLACLSSRIPYGRKINYGLLSKINQAEICLRKLGFRQVRLRDYDRLCRIEVDKKDIPYLVRKRDLIVAKIKGLGYNYVTLDLEGYRTGSLNELLKPKRK
jgi:uncharacterized protein